MLFSISASLNLILEGGVVSNAYLYGSTEFKINLEKSTDSSTKQAHPGLSVSLRSKSMERALVPASWVAVLHHALLRWGFRLSTVERSTFFYRRGTSFILLTVVVDDLTFAFNDQKCIDKFKL